MRILPVTFVLLVACGSTSAHSAASVAKVAAATTTATPAPASSIPTLQAITVTGVVPGPGLWKVSRGDQVLWILGVVPTLPAGIEWRSDQVAQTIAASQTVIESPDVKLKVDVSWFGKLFLLLPVYHAQRNPDGKTLADVLPPPQYARWQAQKQRYFGDDNGIERYRPILAASKLLKKALKANGLRGDGAVDDTVAALAKQYGAKVIEPNTTLVIRHPHQAIKAFAAQGPDGLACFDEVLDAVEHRIPGIRTRANAWATGDIEALRNLPGRNYRETCKSAIIGAGFAKSLGIDNLPSRIENAWLDAVDAALTANMQTFAVLPMHDLLDPCGYLAALRARGYTIEAPDADAEAPATATSAALAPSVAEPAPAVSVN